MSSAFKYLSLAWDDLQTAKLSLNDEWIDSPKQSDHIAVNRFKKALDEFERWWGRENTDKDVREIWTGNAEKAATLSVAWRIAFEFVETSAGGIAFLPRRWHPCSDAIDRIIEAVERVIDHPIAGLPNRLRFQDEMSAELTEIIFKPSTFPISKFVYKSRFDVLKDWLEIKGKKSIADEIDRRIGALLSKLREWESKARSMMDRTMSACQDIRDKGGYAELIDIFGNALREEHDAIFDELYGVQGYLKQASMMLRAEIPPEPRKPVEVAGGEGQKPASDEAAAGKWKPSPKRPSEKQEKIYKVQQVLLKLGESTKEANIVAACLQHGLSVSQPTVNRAIRACVDWQESGGIFSPIELPKRTSTPLSEKILIGPRTNKRTERQRGPHKEQDDK